jgi:hypothetical protein
MQPACRAEAGLRKPMRAPPNRGESLCWARRLPSIVASGNSRTLPRRSAGTWRGSSRRGRANCAGIRRLAR